MAIIGGLLLFLGLPGLMLMLLLNHSHRKENRRLHAMVNTPTTAIAQLVGPDLVELQGRAVASDRGLVTSPLTGRHVLAYEIDIQEWWNHAGSTPGGSFHTVETLSDTREFWIDDGSGARARIAPDQAKLLLPTVSYAESAGEATAVLPEVVHVWSPQIEAWVRDRAPNPDRRLRVRSREIDQGSAIYALGWVEQQNSVMCLRGGEPDRELVLSTLGEAELTALLSKRGSVRRTITLVSACLTVAGLALVLVGIFV